MAVDDAGEIVLANEAFAVMIGYSRQALVSMTVQSLIACIPPPNSDVVSALREYANSVMRLQHADGWTMPALVSDSMLISEGETLAVVALTDLTEIAWHTSPDDELLPG